MSVLKKVERMVEQKAEKMAGLKVLKRAERMVEQKVGW